VGRDGERKAGLGLGGVDQVEHASAVATMIIFE